MIIGISGKILSGKDEVGKIIQYLDLCNKYPHIWKPNANKAAGGDSLGSYDNFLHSDHSWVGDWEIKKFADKLKDIVCLLLNCTREQFEDHDFKNKILGKEWDQISYYVDVNDLIMKDEPYTLHMTPRLLLQLLGTDCGRKIIHNNIWVNALMSEYKQTDYRSFGDPDDSNIVMPDWVITDVRFPNEANSIKEKGGVNIRVNRPNMFDAAIKSTKIEHESETALDYYKFDYVIENNGTIEDLIIKVQSILKIENII